MILNVKPSYLETLSEGSHDIEIVFDDGTAVAKFTIAKAEGSGGDQPAQTGDANDLTTPLILMAAAAIALAGLGLARKRA